MLKRVLTALVCAAVSLAMAKAQNCETRDHVEYTKQIREFTTDRSFQTELTDHLPFNSCVPAPDAFLHHVIGAPNVLDYSKDINGYMRLLASKSPRVKVFDIGKTEEGREMILVAVSDEDNIAALDRYREITAKLADPRKISDQEAEKLIADGKPLYWADGSIHSPETGSPEMLMELTYRLAVEDTPFIQQIRKNSIVLITPLVEVDGHDRYVDIYMHHVKDPKAPMYPLTWWGHYVAHDNNRDQLTLSLALSRNMTNAFLQFHPQVMHDLHESVPFLYIMTGTGPYNAWLDPIVISEFQQMAYYEIEQMTRRGVIGVWTHGFYDGWAPNYLLYIATGHNSIGRFYETFGNGGADTRERTVPPAQTTREWYRPNPPLAKVKWSIRNNINMQQSALLFGMYNVASDGREFLRNFYLKSKRSVAKAREEGPAAWVFPADDTRPGEQAKLLQLLQGQGVEVSRLEKEFRPAPEASRPSPSASRQQEAPALPVASARPDAGVKPDSKTRRASAGAPEPTPKSETQPGQVLPAGSYVVRMDQPYSRWADMVLDTQYYSARDPRSYDDTGWTLGALYNVKAVRVTDTGILEAPMKTVTAPIAVAGTVNGAGKTYLINHTTENALATLRFKLANVKMEAAEQPFEVDGQRFRAGTFIIHDADRVPLESAAKDLGLKIYATNSEVKVSSHAIAAPRIALLHGWQSTQNDGWYRIAFDQLKIPYTYIADTKLRETPNLRQQFDVIILPPMGGFGGGNALNSILRGLPMRGGPMPWKNTAEMPNMVAPGLDSCEDIRGGLGYSGLTNLEKFVSDGGLLIAATSSATLPVNGGMTEMLSISEPRGLTAPGSVLLANIEDKTSPIAYGYDDKLYLYFRDGPIFRVAIGAGPAFGGGDELAGRSSGRGSTSDPDVIQGRKYSPPERPPRRTPREQELYVPDEIMQYAPWAVPPKQEWPRVVLRFAPDKDLLLSGLVQPTSEVAEKPAVIDVPHGKGHVVLFANNPMWRAETSGNYFLLFNAMLNYDHLDAGREALGPDRKPPTAPAGEEE